MDKITAAAFTTDADPVSSGIEYAYHPRIVGAPYSYRLGPDALEWDLGSHNGRLLYREIAFMRFSLRPTNLTSKRYLTEMWSRDGLKLTIASASVKSMFSSEDRGARYRPFVTALAARVEAAAPACRFESGLPQWRWYPAVVFAIATFGAVFYVMVYALMRGEKTVAAMMAAFVALYIWQVGVMLLRNRPRVCNAQTIPAEILP